MKKLIFALLLTFTSPAWACDISGTAGLDAVAVQKLKQACEQAKLEALQSKNEGVVQQTLNTVSGAVTADRISAFGQASKDVAVALGLAAKELGIAANDFITTPAGILTVFVVMWKLFGIQFMGIMFCLFFLWVTGWFVRRVLVEEYTVVEKRRFWGLYTVTKRIPTYSSFSNMSDDQGISIIIACAVCALLQWIFLNNMVL